MSVTSNCSRTSWNDENVLFKVLSSMATDLSLSPRTCREYRRFYFTWQFQPLARCVVCFIPVGNTAVLGCGNTRPPDVNSDLEKPNHDFQVGRASSARIDCTPARVLLQSLGECSRFPPMTPYRPENRGYDIFKFSNREIVSGGLVWNRGFLHLETRSYNSE
jgi:hypothetical protein